MSLTSTAKDGIQVVTVDAERIDAAMAIQFKDDMRSTTDDGPARVILDLTKVNFVDSSGLGAIVAAMKQVGPNRKLDLASLSPMVGKVFRLTRMDTVFNIYDTVQDAIDAEQDDD